MVIEIQNKEIETFLSSFNYKELSDFIEKAIKDKILIYETKQAIKEIKENKTSDAFEFLNELKNENWVKFYFKKGVFKWKLKQNI